MNIDDEERRLIDVTEQPAKFSSSFYTDQTREVKIIREAFNSNNFTQLRDLPNFKRNALLNNSKQKVFSITDNVAQGFKIRGINTYFTPFKYVPTEYEFAKYLNRIKQMVDHEKQLQISMKPFNNGPLNIKKMKYEDQFDIKEQVLPFHLPDDVFDLKQQSQTRQRIIEECSRLAGSFKPAGKKNRRFSLNEIINVLRKVISEDFEHSKFTITSNQENIITIQFHFEENKKEKAYYMNMLLNDDRVSEFQLCRIVEEWGITYNETILSFELRSLLIK